jgi:hypothetical protein
MPRERYSDLSYEERKRREQAKLEAELRWFEMTKEETH